MESTNLTGAGPFTWNVPALGPGDTWRIDLESTEKGKYRKYAPFDTALVKNYNTGIRVDFGINGVYSVDIDPNGKDSYSETPIRVVTVTNTHDTESTADGDVTLSLQKDPFDADDQARQQAAEPPLRGVIRKFTGL